MEKLITDLQSKQYIVFDTTDCISLHTLKHFLNICLKSSQVCILVRKRPSTNFLFNMYNILLSADVLLINGDKMCSFELETYNIDYIHKELQPSYKKCSACKENSLILNFCKKCFNKTCNTCANKQSFCIICIKKFEEDISMIMKEKKIVLTDITSEIENKTFKFMRMKSMKKNELYYFRVTKKTEYLTGTSNATHIFTRNMKNVYVDCRIFSEKIIPTIFSLF